MREKWDGGTLSGCKLCALESCFTEDEAFVNMFIDEATLAAKLNHANIVQIFDFDRIDDTYYIAMEYIEGKDLKKGEVKNQK